MKTTQTPHLKDNYHQHWSRHTISIWRGPVSYNVPPRCPKWIHILRRKENADTWGANVVSKVRTQSYLHSPPPILTRLHFSSPSYLSQQCLRHFVLLKKKMYPDLCTWLHRREPGFCMLFCYLGFPLPFVLLHKMSKTSFQVNKYRTTLSFLMIAYYSFLCLRLYWIALLLIGT